jgi:signal peptidase I
MPENNLENTKMPKNSEENEAEVMEEDFAQEQYEGEEENALARSAKKFGLFVFESLKVIFISLAIIVPIRYFLVQPFIVKGASMEPNFHDREYLIINEIEYRLGDPSRGEVVILKDPLNPQIYFIKRVIGLPGEKVDIKKGRVYINDQELTESYIEDFGVDTFDSVKLSDNQYYVMGDNRTNSFDSRRFGPIDRKSIIGKAWFRGWPWDKINTFNLPKY